MGLISKEVLLAYLRKQPVCELKVLAVTGMKTGETKYLEVRRTGDSPPEIRVSSDENE